MARFNLKAAARLATVAALPVLGVACGHRQLADAPHDGSAAVIESVGDIGFRIDRTVANQGPAPYVLKVNDVLVGSDLSGLATRVVLKPGKVKLLIRCHLPGSALDQGAAGSPAPFSSGPNGEGKISGVSNGGAFALIDLTDVVDAGARYALQCASIGANRARAWITKQAQP